jgi:hypothetical protein
LERHKAVERGRLPPLFAAPWEERHEEEERGIRRTEEARLQSARRLLPEVQRLHRETDWLYDKVKYSLSMGGWPKVREVAADAANALGQLEGELAEIIRATREMRRM